MKTSHNTTELAQNNWNKPQNKTTTQQKFTTLTISHNTAKLAQHNGSKSQYNENKPQHN